MEIKEIALNVLVPYANNSRTHNEAQVAQIAGSIKEFGFRDPILVDESNMILCGHGRVMAARKLGMTTVPAISTTGMTEIEKKAFIIAHNKIAMNAGWDDELLKLELGKLEEEGFDFELTGFSAEEFDALCNTNEVEGESEKKESILDKLDVSIDEPRTQVTKNDKWVLGDKHTLICAEVVKEWDKWVQELEGEKTLFLPFAGIYAALAKKAEEYRLVIVQPDTYIAGLIIDRYQDVHGFSSVRKA